MRIGVVRGISYGLFGKPDEFGPQVEALGAGLVRAFVYWSQVEPEPGIFVWDTVDALLGQIPDGVDLWLTVCSSSPWATRQPTDFLPPSPAKDAGEYARFVGRLVERCRGRVAYWQPDNEPSNADLLWAGSAAEYVDQLRVFADEVRRAQAGPVVLGGCGYDVFGSPEASEARLFFDHVVEHGRDHFDLFSVNLYGDPACVPDYVDTARGMMRAHGYDKPVVVGEYGGPVLFEFPEAGAVLQELFAEAFAGAYAEAGPAAPAAQSRAELAERMGQQTPERRAMAALYDRMPELPPRLRMLMAGCEPELEAKRHRINARQLVMRAVLAMAAGTELTAYWNLAPEVPGHQDPLRMMHLLFGKLPLLDYEGGGVLSRRNPAGDTFARLAAFLSDVDQIRPVPAHGGAALAPVGGGDLRRVTAGGGIRPDAAGGGGVQQVTAGGSVRLFECGGSGRRWIVWDERDPFDGEDQPPVPIALAWPQPIATVTDAFGRMATVTACDGHITLDVTDTPLFVAG